ncbi:MAG: polysaccharide biosynthesis protein [Firmicutes bacterium]|nr:polysaccharide biosynthesis protein [Bacillota bacterium]
MTKKSFVRGAAILAIAGLANRVVGAVSRIVLPALIGDEGMGLFQMAYPIYSIFLVVSTAGVPVAVSKLVAEQAAKGNSHGARRILRVAATILFLTGAIGTLILVASADVLSSAVLRDRRAALPIIATAPAVLILSFMSAFRGYFQGLQEMERSANSQIAEQLIRVFSMISLAYFLLPKGIDFSAAGASFGAVLGGIAGLIVILIPYYRQSSGSDKRGANSNLGLRGGQGDSVDPLSEGYMVSSAAIAGRIFSLSIPIVIGASIMPLMQVVDAVLIPMRLNAAGVVGTQVTRLYGQLTGMALPLVYFPTVITTALAASAVPAVSEALAYKDRRMLISRSQDVIWFGALIGLPSSLGLFLLADEFCAMFYRLPAAGVSLRAVAFGTLFLCLQQTSSGVLQGLGEVTVPVRNLFVGAILKAIVNYVFTGIPAIGIKGAAWGTVIGFAISSILNLLYLSRKLGLALDIQKHLIKPLIATCVMGIAVTLTYRLAHDALGSNTLATLSATAIGAAIYGLLLLVTGAISSRDIALLPMGAKISKILVKLGLIRDL